MSNNLSNSQITSISSVCRYFILSLRYLRLKIKFYFSIENIFILCYFLFCSISMSTGFVWLFITLTIGEYSCITGEYNQSLSMTKNGHESVNLKYFSWCGSISNYPNCSNNDVGDFFFNRFISIIEKNQIWFVKTFL